MKKVFDFTLIRKHFNGKILVLRTPCVPGTRALGVWNALLSKGATPLDRISPPIFERNRSYFFVITKGINGAPDSVSYMERKVI